SLLHPSSAIPLHNPINLLTRHLQLHLVDTAPNLCFHVPPTTHIYTLSLHDALPISFNQILKQNAKREMRLRLGKVTVADVLAAQPVTTNLLKFMRASIKMIGVSNLQSFIASMTQKLTLSDISDESKNYLDKAGI